MADNAERVKSAKDGSISPSSSAVEEGRKRKRDESLAVDIPARSGEDGAPSTSRAAGTSSPGPQLPPWVAGSSPAKFMGVDELLQMSQAMDNLALVHEIAIDPNFKISQTPSNAIERAVKDAFHRAYWDILREDLARQPPDYAHAIRLVLEIKQEIFSLLTPRHVRLRDEINFRLDENRLQAQVDEKTLDVKAIAHFILDLLGRLCAPARDELITQLRQEEDVVLLIKGIFELIDLMKDDLANYALSQNRAHVEEYSARIELEQYREYLNRFPDGSALVKAWLRSSLKELNEEKRVVEQSATVTPAEEPTAKKERTDQNGEPSEKKDEFSLEQITAKGFVRLLRGKEQVPETLRIDAVRIAALAEKLLQLEIVTSCIFITTNLAGRKVAETEGFKTELKNHLIVISNDIEENNLHETLEAMAEQCVAEVKKTISGEEWNLDVDLKSQILACVAEDQPVRKLVRGRICTFIESVVCGPAKEAKLGAGLTPIHQELFALTARYLRICQHNLRTFHAVYAEHIETIKAEEATG